MSYALVTAAGDATELGSDIRSGIPLTHPLPHGGEEIERDPRPAGERGG